MTKLDFCKRLLDSDLSLITIGDKKVPNIKWKQFQDKAMSKADFEKVYTLPSTKGVGILTGYNNLEVIDVDLKTLPSLKMQQDFWNELIGLLRDNIDDFDKKFTIYKTINNGYHILYKCEKIEGNTKIAKLKNHTQAIIETRGIGGYVFIYENKVSTSTYSNIQEISIKDRDILFQCCRFYNYEVEEPKIVEKEYEGNKISPWDDYNSKNSCLDLLSDSFDIISRLSDKILIRRHGAESAYSGYIYNDSGMMFLFSTGTIYPAEKLLNPFMIYCYKYHHGNVTEAARQLYKDGFGTRRKTPAPEPIGEKVDYSKIEFPLYIFPEPIQNYIIECNKTLNSSIDYMGCSMMWMLSVIIGNSMKIQVKKGWIEPVTVWISLVGKAGIGKTPSVKNIINPLVKLNNTEITSYVKQYKKYLTYSELDKKEKELSEEVFKPVKKQFIVNDITQEALIELHEENKNSIGVHKDELSGWFKDMNKYRAGSDLQFWLSSWSNEGVSLNRKTAKSSFVQSPIIPVIGGIQPNILNDFYTDENKDNGFVDRMLTCFPELEIDVYSEAELDDSILTWYNDFISNFYHDVRMSILRINDDGEVYPHICVYSKEAKKLWQRIFNDITALQNSEEENEYMKSMLPKQKSYIPRFALLLHVLDCCFDDASNMYVISENSLNKAESLSKYFVMMAKKIKIDSSERNRSKKILLKNDLLSTKEKYFELIKANPHLTQKEAADLLAVSIRQIQRFKA